MNLTRREALQTLGCASIGAVAPMNSLAQSTRTPKRKPNIILIMTDDQGWGQTGYNNHPVLKTPNLDAMAANGLRFDRFYAGAPVCSPTRASVLTGRANDRCGVPSHGYALRRQEKTLAQALKQSGYATGHFGKWHLNGRRGPGVPLFEDDSHHPGVFGFDTWLSVSNFFEINPVMSRNGEFVELEGSSSEVIVDEAISFIEKSTDKDKPFFAVIWDGTPHVPWKATEEDISEFADLNNSSKHHYGELVAFDRSMGHLRSALREMNLAEDTIIWYCSDNGGLRNIEPDTVGGLRGHKGSLWEGGIRVPGIVEWPGTIRPGVTDHPAVTMDIFPTLADIVGLPDDSMLKPVDGISLQALFHDRQEERSKPIPFRYRNGGAWIDGAYKLVTTDLSSGTFELYNLENDPAETTDLSSRLPDRFEQMKSEFLAWNETVEASVAGQDYPEGKVLPGEPEPIQWVDDERYRPYFDEWRNRWEYRNRISQKDNNERTLQTDH